MERRYRKLSQRMYSAPVALGRALMFLGLVGLLATNARMVGGSVAFASPQAHASAARPSGKCPPPAAHDRLHARAYAFQVRHYGCIIPSYDALKTARHQAAALSSTGGNWTALGPQPLDSAPIGSGIGHVTGRITAIAVNPKNSNQLWVGGAAGGAWVSSDGGQH